MPWPMRFGPEPRISTLRRPECDLVFVLVGRVVVRRLRLELGAAGVDGLEGGSHAGGRRAARTSPSGTDQSQASCASAKPELLGAAPGGPCRGPDLGEDRSLLGDGEDLIEEPRVDLGASRRPPRRAMPRRSAPRAGTAGPACRSRPAGAAPRRSRRRGARSAGSQARPSRPSSSERKAFWNDSGNVRPMAIASPTDCIEVPSTPGVPGNFSKAHRGTLVTT